MDEQLPQSKSVEFYELSGILFPGVLVLLAAMVLLWAHGGAPLPDPGTEGKFGFAVGFGTVFLVVAYLCGHATVAGAVVAVDAMLLRRVIGRPQFWLLNRDVAWTRSRRADNRLAGMASFLILSSMMFYVGAAWLDARWEEPLAATDALDPIRADAKTLDNELEAGAILLMRWSAYIAITLLLLRGAYRAALRRCARRGQNGTNESPDRQGDPVGDDYPELLSLEDERQRAKGPFRQRVFDLREGMMGSRVWIWFRQAMLSPWQYLCVGIELLAMPLGSVMTPLWTLLKFLGYTRPLPRVVAQRALSRLRDEYGSPLPRATSAKAKATDNTEDPLEPTLFQAIDDSLMPLMLTTIERCSGTALERLRRLYNLYRIARNGFFAAAIATILVSKAARAEINPQLSMAIAYFAVLLAVLSIGLLLRALHLNGAVYYREAIQYFALAHPHKRAANEDAQG